MENNIKLVIKSERTTEEANFDKTCLSKTYYAETLCLLAENVFTKRF